MIHAYSPDSHPDSWEYPVCGLEYGRTVSPNSGKVTCPKCKSWADKRLGQEIDDANARASRYIQEEQNERLWKEWRG